MHDKAHERFRKLNINEKNDFFQKLFQQYELHDLKDGYLGIYMCLFT